MSLISVYSERISTRTHPKSTRMRRMKKSSDAMMILSCIGMKTTARMRGTIAALLGRMSIRKPAARAIASASGCMSP